jgi:osmoprotectant transport system substrate-binding protein
MLFLRSFKSKAIPVLLLCSLLALAACGTSGNTDTGNSNTSKGPITVGSKLDTEAQLLGKMYSLLLKKAGFTVNEKLALGNSTIISQAIKSGQIDLYPEFTNTALAQLKIPSTYDPKKDYQAAKDAYKQQFQITWLDASPLNDGYAVCMTSEQSQALGITKLSDLTAKAKDLTLASPSDGTDFVDGLKTVYGLTTKSFKATNTVDYALAVTAVKSNQAQAMVCYTTDGSLKSNGIIFLDDDKHGFPEFNPAPIVRDQVLQKYPEIATALNALAPKLTTDISITLQGQVATKKNGGMSVNQAITEVATQFLKDQGLL